jgi:7-keto-8-aminopelargonate synthetase-like enzyme
VEVKNAFMTLVTANAIDVGIILSNDTVKSALINFARPTVYSAAPPFPFVAAIRAGHRLLGTPEAVKASAA